MKSISIFFALLLSLAFMGACTTPGPAAQQQNAFLVNFVAINAANQATYQASIHLDKDFAAGKLDQPTYATAKAAVKVASDAIATAYANWSVNRAWSQADTDAVNKAFQGVILDWANAEMKAKGLAPILIPPIPPVGSQP